MIKTRETTRQVKEVEDVICNRCSNSCKIVDGYNFEAALLEVEWGYGSQADGDRYIAHICETCFFEIIKDFQIPCKE